ncbi:MAG: hypothetical protein H0V44_05605, partial [Planctomycetes bacterium]|nr:hypothetical protein [Planctomycetota bacterium]
MMPNLTGHAQSMKIIVTVMYAALLLAGNAVAGEAAYSCLRVVRAQAGTPSNPSIALPGGYSLERGSGYEVPSPGEFHAFIRGPRGNPHVSISWPGVAIAAVIVDDTYLALRGDPGSGSISCQVPVTKSSLRNAWSTFDVFSYPGEDDLLIRVEHNHPARRAGWYLENPWLTGQPRAMVNWIFSARIALRDWRIHQRVGDQGKGSFGILGYESVNPLHIDNPPHWHLIHYLPGDAGTQVPHYYMDGGGRLVSNKVEIIQPTSSSPPTRVFGPEESVIFRDADGSQRYVTAIRSDGGLDLGERDGEWLYSIIPSSRGDFIVSARILRHGQSWAEIATTDDVAYGVLTIRTRMADGTFVADEVHLYDPLTGKPRSRSSNSGPPAYGMTIE